MRWNATGYDASFSFVTAYGADLLDLLDVHPGERVLDLGCGTGHQAAELAARGATVVGVDSDAAMLDLARSEHPGIEFVQADGQDPAALRRACGGTVDALLSNAALHWMPDQDAAIAAIAGVLGPGGRVVAELGAAGTVARLSAAIRAARADLGLDPEVASSWTFPTAAQTAARLEAQGLRVDLLQTFDRPTPLRTSAAGWARMFGAALLDGVADEVADDGAADAAFAAAVDRHARDLGLAEGPDGPGEERWWADYVRLRFQAHRPA
jgi:trans-aconitate methyltransferase